MSRVRTMAMAVVLVLALAFAFLPSATAAQAPVGLGTAASFAVLAGATVTNTGDTVLEGDLGVSPGSAITGFPPGVVHGSVHQNDAVAIQAQSDLALAYDDVAGRTPATDAGTELGGQTLKAGVYDSASGTFDLTGTLTLDAEDDPDAVFIFQTESTLITASASVVQLARGAQACNVFWKVGSSATLGTDTMFRGTILALTSITLTTGADVEGRALARNGAVTLDTNTITTPTCADAAPPDGGTGDGDAGDGGTDDGGTDDGGTGDGGTGDAGTGDGGTGDGDAADGGTGDGGTGDGGAGDGGVGDGGPGDGDAGDGTGEELPESPSCAENVVAVANQDDSIRLAWNAGAAADGYAVWRAVSGGDFERVALASATSFVDRDTEVGVTYQYKVTSFVEGVEGHALCAVVEVTAIPFFPAPAGFLVAALGGVAGYVWLRRR